MKLLTIIVITIIKHHYSRHTNTALTLNQTLFLAYCSEHINTFKFHKQVYGKVLLKGRNILVLPFFFFKSREPLHREVKKFSQVYTAGEEFMFPASRAHFALHYIRNTEDFVSLPVTSNGKYWSHIGRACWEPPGPLTGFRCGAASGEEEEDGQRKAELGCMDRMALKPWWD